VTPGASPPAVACEECGRPRKYRGAGPLCRACFISILRSRAAIRRDAIRRERQARKAAHAVARATRRRLEQEAQRRMIDEVLDGQLWIPLPAPELA
jgi:hypothetical protein